MKSASLLLAILIAPAAAAAQSIPGGWEPQAPGGTAPNGDNGSATVLMDNRWLYVVDRSGFFQLDVKSPMAWIRKAAFPGFPGDGCCASVGSGKVWIIDGGSDGKLRVYDPAGDSWSESVPPPASTHNMAMTSDGTILYLLISPPWSGEQVAGTFYSLDTSLASPAWQMLPEFPWGFGMIGACAAIVNGDLYACGGGDFNRKLWKYSGGAWGETGFDTPARPGPRPPNQPPGREMGLNGGLISDGARLLCHPGTPFNARGSTLEAVGLWRLNDEIKWDKIAEFPGADRSVGGFPTGTNTVYATDTKRLYHFRSGATSDLWILDMAMTPPVWMLASPAPAPLKVPLLNIAGATKIVGKGGATAGANGKLYLMTGGWRADFLSYDPAEEAPRWTNLAPLPGVIGGLSLGSTNDDGGSLVFDGRRYLYAVGSALNFWRHDTLAPAPGAWTSLPSLPDGSPTTPFATLVHVPADPAKNIVETVYLFGEKNTSRVLKHVVGSSGWTTGANAPEPFQQGLAAVRPAGESRIFVLRGGDVRFWAYDLERDAWIVSGVSDPADLPQGTIPGAGASLCQPASGKFVYAQLGSSYGHPNETWIYQLPNTGPGANTWTRLAQAPVTVDMGGSLAYPGRGGHIYATQGNNTGVVTRYQIPNEMPLLGETLQAQADGTTPIPAGGSSFEGGWSVSMVSVDSDDDAMVAEIQYRLLGEPDYRTILSEPFEAEPFETDARGLIFVPATVVGNYEWRARAVDLRGAASPWFEYGGRSGVTDVRVRTENLLPSTVPALIDGATGGAVPPGSWFPYGHFDVKVAARLDDPDGLGDRGRIEVRVLSILTGSVLAESAGDVADPGKTTEAHFVVEDEGDYAVRYRYVDEFGLTTAWTPLSAEAFDFHIPRNGSVGAPVGCLKSAAGKGAGIAAGILVAGIAALLRRTR